MWAIRVVISSSRKTAPLYASAAVSTWPSIAATSDWIWATRARSSEIEGAPEASVDPIATTARATSDATPNRKREMLNRTRIAFRTQDRQAGPN